MATIGWVPEFDNTKEYFDTFLERFERWVAANEIDSGKKVDVFLSVLGPIEYGLLKSLVEPVKVVDLTYPKDNSDPFWSFQAQAHFDSRTLQILSTEPRSRRNNIWLSLGIQAPGKFMRVLDVSWWCSSGQICLWAYGRSLSQKVNVRKGPHLQKGLWYCSCIRTSTKRYQAAEHSSSHKGLQCA